MGGDDDEFELSDETILAYFEELDEPDAAGDAARAAETEGRSPRDAPRLGSGGAGVSAGAPAASAAGSRLGPRI